jgi:hypothetical protein
VNGTWAFCLTERRDAVIAALRENLHHSVPGATFVEEVDPQDFFPDADGGAARSKREWAQVAYYVTQHGPWTCFSYATGFEPFELHEPREVARRAAVPVLELEVDDMAGLRTVAWKEGREALSIDTAGRATRGDRELAEAEVLQALHETFGEKPPQALLAGLTGGPDRAHAITTHLGIVPPGEDIAYFEPEDAFPEGHIVAFNRR